MTKEAIGIIIGRVACDVNYPETTEQEIMSTNAVKILWKKLVEAESKQNKGK